MCDGKVEETKTYLACHAVGVLCHLPEIREKGVSKGNERQEDRGGG